MHNYRKNMIIRQMMIMILFWIPLFLNAQAALTAADNIFDFGTIREGEHASIVFELVNTGSSPVQIKEIRTFASCVQRFPFEKKKIEAKQRRKLNLTFESLGFGSVTINRKIEIQHSGKDSPLTLTVKGRVLALEPFQAPLGEAIYNYFVLIDISSEAAFKQSHLMGAIHVPEAQFLQWMDSISSKLSEEIVIYIYSEVGKKSDVAAKRLHKKGYTQAVSLVGGLAEWKKRYGEKWLISGRRFP